MKILVVWDRMGDYHRIRTETYKKQFGTDKLFTADLGSSDNLYHWKNTEGEGHYSLSKLPAGKRDIKRRFAQFKQIIKEHKIQKVVLSGYGKPEYLLFTLWLKTKRIDCYYFAESWYPGSYIMDRVKNKFLQKFVRGIFASGERAKEHFSKRLNFPVNLIRTGYSVVDNNHFLYTRNISEVEEALAKKPVLLCVARHSPEKNLLILIRSFQNSDLYPNWKLRIVGGGPLTEDLKKEVQDPSKVELMHWQSYHDLPKLYKEASCFILPSSFEPWGLVVNEAMAASLPVILSKQCGCVPDLLDGNGFVFDALDTKMLIGTLNKLNSTSAEELHGMGKRSFHIIKNYIPTTWAQNLNTLLKN
ncbi:glycosyltransferase family 4 protein [Salinimicrobium sediminilitoris]|uniref:glycosyltransferase family 4 protein n=1 Tax=Salinimicrobium sediminilitoris TaxID=2876715 RepID=UPI001E56897A|nr:glycosyltransferase family 4 protein [Salinimicrobium sediminilitoris]MCC8358448.1 glycosyltransferase family 4 protein [Salinimicrobium sediminilitoris]